MIDCRSCGGALTEVITLGDIYINEFREDDKFPEKAPVNVAVCSDCTLAQLTESVSPKKMFNDNYGYESGINGMIRADLKSIVDQVTSYLPLGESAVVVDIAANDGQLLSNYHSSVIRIGVDPVKKFKEKSLKHADYIIDDFFSAEPILNIIDEEFLRSAVKVNIVTSISMFYDLENPNQFCDDVYKILDDEGIWVVQQNYLLAMMEQNAFCNILHEHLEYYSMLSMQHLLQRHGFRIFHVEENSTNGGSFRTLICKENAHFITDSTVSSQITKEIEAGLNTLEPFNKFNKDIVRLSSELHDLVVDLNQMGYGVGALAGSTRGNTLLQMAKLDNKLLQYAVERNPYKFGKKIASIQLPMISEEEANKNPVDYLIILPWFFAEEILKREKEFLDNGGICILPLPEVRLYDKNGFIN